MSEITIGSRLVLLSKCRAAHGLDVSTLHICVARHLPEPAVRSANASGHTRSGMGSLVAMGHDTSVLCVVKGCAVDGRPEKYAGDEQRPNHEESVSLDGRRRECPVVPALWTVEIGGQWHESLPYLDSVL